MQKLKHTLARWIGRQTLSAAITPVPAAQIQLPRSALIGRDGRIAGWVLRESSLPLAQNDFVCAARYASALGRCTVLPAQQRIFENNALLDALPSGTILYVESLPAAQAKTAKRLRSRGIQIASDLPTNNAATHRDSNFAVLREVQPIDQKQAAIVFPLAGSAACVAALNRGAHFVGGTFNDRLLALDSSSNAIVHVLQELVSGASVERSAAQLSADRSLRYRLLRFANAQDRSFTKGSDAVLRLLEQQPRDALLQTLWLLLATADRTQRIAPALHELAITRARTMELLATRITPAVDRLGAQLAGLCSMLTPGTAATLPLPADAQLALQRGHGPLIDLLNLSCALECADVPAIERLSQQYKLPIANVLSLHAQAVDWAVETAALTTDAE